MSQDGSGRSDLPAGGKEELGGVSHSESIMVLGRPEGRSRHHQGFWPRTCVRRNVWVWPGCKRYEQQWF